MLCKGGVGNTMKHLKERIVEVCIKGEWHPTEKRDIKQGMIIRIFELDYITRVKDADKCDEFVVLEDAIAGDGTLVKELFVRGLVKTRK